jgi:hypothetical protein
MCYKIQVESLFHWGAMKRHLQEHYLWPPKNIPDALASVDMLYHLEVGTSYHLMDGCSPRRKGHQGGPDSGEEIQQPQSVVVQIFD